MTNQPVGNHQAGAHGSYERQDMNPRGVIYFFLALAVFLVVIYAIAFGIYRLLDSYNHANQATMSPMVVSEADTRTPTDKDTKAFPEPRLEKSEPERVLELVTIEDRQLATYNWLDKDKGVVQIPIDRAIDLIVQRGLPVRPAAKGQETEQKEGGSAQ